MRQFTVTKGILGYHVQIGCQFVCVSEANKDELKALICEYIDNSEEVEKKYYRKYEPEHYSTIGPIRHFTSLCRK